MNEPRGFWWKNIAKYKQKNGSIPLKIEKIIRRAKLEQAEEDRVLIFYNQEYDIAGILEKLDAKITQLKK